MRTCARNKTGQAAIEFVVCLLLILLVLTGIIHVARLARTSLFLHAVLRGDAGRRAMRSGTLARAPTHISDWSPGADNIRHTADDQPVHRGMVVPNTAQTLTDFSVRSASDWTFVAPDSRLPLSMIRLRESPNSVTIVGFAHGEGFFDACRPRAARTRLRQRRRGYQRRGLMPLMEGSLILT